MTNSLLRLVPTLQGDFNELELICLHTSIAIVSIQFEVVTNIAI